MTDELTLSDDNFGTELAENPVPANVTTCASQMAVTGEETVSEIDALVEHNKKNGWPSLSAKERMFAHNFLIFRQIGKAARETGISNVAGGRALRHPVVSAFVQHLQELQAIRFNIDSDFAVMEMLEAMEKFKGDVAVPMIDADGLQFEGKKFHADQYMAVIKELNKISGLNNQSITGGAGGVTVKIDMGTMCSRPMDIKVTGNTYDNE